MAGIDSHVDTDVGPLLSGMVDAFTLATADLDIVDDSPQKPPATPQQQPQAQASSLPPPATPDVYLTPVGKPAFRAPAITLDFSKATLAEMEEALTVQGRALVDAKLVPWMYRKIRRGAYAHPLYTTFITNRGGGEGVTPKSHKHLEYAPKYVPCAACTYLAHV